MAERPCFGVRMIRSMTELYRKLYPEEQLHMAKGDDGRYFYFGKCPCCLAENMIEIQVGEQWFKCHNCNATKSVNELLDERFGPFSDERVSFVLEKDMPLNEFDYREYSNVAHAVNHRLSNADSQIVYELPEDREQVEPCARCGRSHFMYVITKSNVKPYCLFCGQHQPVPRKLKNASKTKAPQRSAKATSFWSSRVYNRYEGRCAICGSTDRLEAHHIVPWSVDEDCRYNVNNGILLCKKHHDMIHTNPIYIHKGK